MIPTRTFIQFLLEEGFVLSFSDPFCHTYTRGKIVLVIDPESPAQEESFLKEDIERQATVEDSVKEKLWERFGQYLHRQTGS